MKRFDNYIRKYTNKDLEVPAELSWDEMNIPLPGKKKKRRGFLWLVLLLAGMFMGMLFHMLIHDASKAQNNQSALQDQKESIAHKDQVANSNLLSNDFNATDSQVEANEEGQAIEELDKEIIISENIPSSISRNLGFESLTNTSKAKDLKASKNEVFIVENKSQALNRADRLIIADQSETIQEELKLPFQELNKLTLLQPLKFSLTSEGNINYSVALPSLSPQKLKEERRFSLLLNSGYTYSSMHYSSGNQVQSLRTAEDSGHGIKTDLGLRYKLNNGLFLSADISYQRLRSFFMYSENLGTEYSQILSQKVMRIRHICHNNSMEAIGLRLGMGKSILFNHRWGSEASLAIVTDYQLRSNGRTLQEDLSVFQMNNYSAKQRILYSTYASIGVFAMLDSYKIIGSIGWQHGLSNAKFLNDSNLSYSPRVMSLNLGIEKRL